MSSTVNVLNHYTSEPHFAVHWNGPGIFRKHWCLAPTCKYSDLISTGCDLGKWMLSSPIVSNVKYGDHCALPFCRLIILGFWLSSLDEYQNHLILRTSRPWPHPRPGGLGIHRFLMLLRWLPSADKA